MKTSMRISSIMQTTKVNNGKDILSLLKLDNTTGNLREYLETNLICQAFYMKLTSPRRMVQHDCTVDKEPHRRAVQCMYCRSDFG